MPQKIRVRAFLSRTFMLQKILRCLTCKVFKHMLKSMKPKLMPVLDLTYGYANVDNLAVNCTCLSFESPVILISPRTFLLLE